MARITGNSIAQRKKCLAGLVRDHLFSIGKPAALVHNRINSLGHKDLITVDSSIGLIHVIASNTGVDSAIPLGDYINQSQDFLADKDFVVFGWNTEADTTLLSFVPTERIKGHFTLTKGEIEALGDSELSTVLSMPQNKT